MGLLLSSRQIPHRAECSAQERWHLWYGTIAQHRDSGSCSFNSLPRATNPYLQYSSLLSLPSTGAQISGCKQNFVHWPFKRLPVSLTDSCLSLVDRNPAAFHSQMLYGHLFPALVLWVGEPSLGVRFHTSQGTPHPLQLRYLYGTSVATCGYRTSPFRVSTLPTSLNVSSSVNPRL